MTNPSPSVTEELERLAALHKSGMLTDEEFKALKARLLNPQSIAVTPTKEQRSLFKQIVLWSGVCFVAFIVSAYVNAEYPEVFLAGLPKCDSPEARKMVERTVEESSVGLARGRKIIQWISDASQDQATSTMVRCYARVMLNAGGETGMAYAFEEKGDDIFINVEFR